MKQKLKKKKRKRKRNSLSYIRKKAPSVGGLVGKILLKSSAKNW